MKFRIAALAALAFATPAQADWMKAESEHFVVYADDSERDLRHFAEILERYHTAMELVTGRKSKAPSPSNRVTIYAVGSQKDVRELNGGSRFTGGFYIPRAGASAAFVPNVRPSSGELERSMITLLHEYAHHFLIGSSRYAMPVWMNEGAADFFASSRFPRNGGAELGRPAHHRAMELKYAVNVPIEDLLSRTHSLPLGKNAKYDEFYGRSWTLYHYLTFEPNRRGQLIAYARRVAEGASSLDAAREVFGDLQVLDKELDRYLKQRKMLGFTFTPEALSFEPITITRLSEGHAEMLPVLIRSKRGVTEEQAGEVLAEAKLIAAKYPQDAHVLAALAEAEQDAGNRDGAIAAADRAIAIDPAVKNAYVQKGLALFDKAIEENDDDALFAQSLGAFSALNKMEQDHPIPLIFYYRILLERGKEPTENARHALERALQLAPFDLGLATHVGRMQAGEGKIALARQTLAPAAADPHGRGYSRLARIMRDQLAQVPEGTPWSPRMQDVISAQITKQASEEEGEDLPEEETGS